MEAHDYKKEKREVSRLTRVPVELGVKSKTLGTPITYDFSTVNISKSGLLIEKIEGTPQAPFQVNTLIEMTIDPTKKVLTSPVACMGKVIRKDDSSSEYFRFGVQIVQIDQQDREQWDRCLDELAGRGVEFSSFSDIAKA